MWLNSKPKRIKIAVGGRGSGKSIGVGDIMLTKVRSGHRVCGTREFQNSIDDSVHESLKQELMRLDIPGMWHDNNHVKSVNGGEMFYKGLARNITSLKSLAGTDFLWIEEGESVSDNSLKVLTPSVRAKIGSDKIPEIWITMNRNSREDAIAKKYLARAENDLATKGWYEDEICMIVQVNYQDNPWFPPELEQERLDDLERLDEDEYDWIWNGAYNESVEDALIRKKVFDACIDAHKHLGITPLGQRRVIFDPADTGDDAKGYTMHEGILVVEAGEVDKKDGNSACDWILCEANKFRADMFVWDGDGMGALLRKDINAAFKGRDVDVRMFKGSSAVENPKQVYDGVYRIGRSDTPKTNQETFFNRKIQYGVRLADRMWRTYNWVKKGIHCDPETIISINSEIKLLDKLRSEVCRLPLKPNPSGKIQFMGKPEMKTKYGILSPNMADCLIMEQQEMKVRAVADIDFTGW